MNLAEPIDRNVRNEIIQDVIDRLLYLPENERAEFMVYLDRLFKVYSTQMEIIDGIRIYNVKKTNQ